MKIPYKYRNAYISLEKKHTYIPDLFKIIPPSFIAQNDHLFINAFKYFTFSEYHYLKDFKSIKGLEIYLRKNHLPQEDRIFWINTFLEQKKRFFYFETFILKYLPPFDCSFVYEILLLHRVNFEYGFKDVKMIDMFRRIACNSFDFLEQLVVDKGVVEPYAIKLFYFRNDDPCLLSKKDLKNIIKDNNKNFSNETIFNINDNNLLTENYTNFADKNVNDVENDFISTQNSENKVSNHLTPNPKILSVIQKIHKTKPSFYTSYLLDLQPTHRMLKQEIDSNMLIYLNSDILLTYLFEEYLKKRDKKHIISLLRKTKTKFTSIKLFIMDNLFIPDIVSSFLSIIVCFLDPFTDWFSCFFHQDVVYKNYESFYRNIYFIKHHILCDYERIDYFMKYSFYRNNFYRNYDPLNFIDSTNLNKYIFDRPDIVFYRSINFSEKNIISNSVNINNLDKNERLDINHTKIKAKNQARMPELNNNHSNHKNNTASNENSDIDLNLFRNSDPIFLKKKHPNEYYQSFKTPTKHLLSTKLGILCILYNLNKIETHIQTQILKENKNKTHVLNKYLDLYIWKNVKDISPLLPHFKKIHDDYLISILEEKPEKIDFSYYLRYSIYRKKCLIHFTKNNTMKEIIENYKHDKDFVTEAIKLKINENVYDNFVVAHNMIKNNVCIVKDLLMNMNNVDKRIFEYLKGDFRSNLDFLIILAEKEPKRFANLVIGLFKDDCAIYEGKKLVKIRKFIIEAGTNIDETDKIITENIIGDNFDNNNIKIFDLKDSDKSEGNNDNETKEVKVEARKYTDDIKKNNNKENSGQFSNNNSINNINFTKNYLKSSKKTIDNVLNNNSKILNAKNNIINQRNNDNILNNNSKIFNTKNSIINQKDDINVLNNNSKIFNTKNKIIYQKDDINVLNNNCKIFNTKNKITYQKDDINVLNNNCKIFNAKNNIDNEKNNINYQIDRENNSNSNKYDIDSNKNVIYKYIVEKNPHLFVQTTEDLKNLLEIYENKESYIYFFIEKIMENLNDSFFQKVLTKSFDNSYLLYTIKEKIKNKLKDSPCINLLNCLTNKSGYFTEELLNLSKSISLSTKAVQILKTTETQDFVKLNNKEMVNNLISTTFNYYLDENTETILIHKIGEIIRDLNRSELEFGKNVLKITSNFDQFIISKKYSKILNHIFNLLENDRYIDEIIDILRKWAVNDNDIIEKLIENLDKNLRFSKVLVGVLLEIENENEHKVEKLVNEILGLNDNKTLHFLAYVPSLKCYKKHHEKFVPIMKDIFLGKNNEIAGKSFVKMYCFDVESFLIDCAFQKNRKSEVVEIFEQIINNKYCLKNEIEKGDEKNYYGLENIGEKVNRKNLDRYKNYNVKNTEMTDDKENEQSNNEIIKNSCKIDVKNSEIVINNCKTDEKNNKIDKNSCIIDVKNNEMTKNSCKIDEKNNEITKNSCRIDEKNNEIDKNSCKIDEENNESVKNSYRIDEKFDNNINNPKNIDFNRIFAVLYLLKFDSVDKIRRKAFELWITHFKMGMIRNIMYDVITMCFYRNKNIEVFEIAMDEVVDKYADVVDEYILSIIECLENRLYENGLKYCDYDDGIKYENRSLDVEIFDNDKKNIENESSMIDNQKDENGVFDNNNINLNNEHENKILDIEKLNDKTRSKNNEKRIINNENITNKGSNNNKNKKNLENGKTNIKSLNKNDENRVLDSDNIDNKVENNKILSLNNEKHYKNSENNDDKIKNHTSRYINKDSISFNNENNIISELYNKKSYEMNKSEFIDELKISISFILLKALQKNKMIDTTFKFTKIYQNEEIIYQLILNKKYRSRTVDIIIKNKMEFEFLEENKEFMDIMYSKTKDTSLIEFTSDKLKREIISKNKYAFKESDNCFYVFDLGENELENLTKISDSVVNNNINGSEIEKYNERQKEKRAVNYMINNNVDNSEIDKYNEKKNENDIYNSITDDKKEEHYRINQPQNNIELNENLQNNNVFIIDNEKKNSRIKDNELNQINDSYKVCDLDLTNINIKISESNIKDNNIKISKNNNKNITKIKLDNIFKNITPSKEWESFLASINPIYSFHYLKNEVYDYGGLKLIFEKTFENLQDIDVLISKFYANYIKDVSFKNVKNFKKLFDVLVDGKIYNRIREIIQVYYDDHIIIKLLEGYVEGINEFGECVEMVESENPVLRDYIMGIKLFDNDL